MHNLTDEIEVRICETEQKERKKGFEAILLIDSNHIYHPCSFLGIFLQGLQIFGI